MLAGGIVAGRRAAPAPVKPDQLPVPDFLLAGPCCEVWCPERTPTDEWSEYSVKVWTRARNARRAWLELRGLDRSDESVPLPLRQASTPWSFDWLAGHDPDRLARMLADRGLPASWQPTPAPPLLLDLPRQGPPSPRAADLLIGHLR